MRELLTVEEYLGELLALVQPDERAEELALTGSFGRVLAAEVVGGVSVPVFDNSAMDGYAVRFADVAAVPARLRVVGEVAAGSAADPPAGPGECVRIMTGAPLPGFADTVVPVEDTDGGLEVVTVNRVPARLAAHVRRAGEDFAAGSVLAEPGAELSPALVGALAAAGVTRVAVRPRPVVAVCATGDELVTDGAQLRRGQIYESNSLALAAALTRDGAEALHAEPVGDQADELVAWLDSITGERDPSPTHRHPGFRGDSGGDTWRGDPGFRRDDVGRDRHPGLDPGSLQPGRVDLVILTGGASVGAYDVVRDVLQAASGTFRHVRVQPGKPQGWAMWNHTPVVALPGNPLSASLSYEVFVRPMLDRLLGRAEPPWLIATAEAGWTSPAGRRQLVPVRLSSAPDGRLLARPAHARGSASHVVTSLAGADGIAVVAEDVTEVAPGDLLPVRWL